MKKETAVDVQTWSLGLEAITTKERAFSSINTAYFLPNSFFSNQIAK
jgi:hypothetical protein